MYLYAIKYNVFNIGTPHAAEKNGVELDLYYLY